MCNCSAGISGEKSPVLCWVLFSASAIWCCPCEAVQRFLKSRTQEVKWVCLDNTKKYCKGDRNINSELLFRDCFVKCILAAWFSSVRGMFLGSFTFLYRDILIYIYADIPQISRFHLSPFLLKTCSTSLLKCQITLQRPSVSFLTFTFFLLFLLSPQWDDHHYAQNYFGLDDRQANQILVTLITLIKAIPLVSYSFLNEIQNTRRFSILWKIK